VYEFLTIDDALAIHRLQLEKFGGQDGVRELSLLESALAMPPQSFGGDYVHEDLFAMAGAYLFYICKNHPFLDGNKRTAAAMAAVFLGMNGFFLVAEPSAFTDLTLAIAESRARKQDASDFFRLYSRQIK